MPILVPSVEQIAELDHAQFAGQTQHFHEQFLERLQVNLAKIADGTKVGRRLAHDGTEGQITFASRSNLPAGTNAYAVAINQECYHHGDIERRLTAQFAA